MLPLSASHPATAELCPFQRSSGTKSETKMQVLTLRYKFTKKRCHFVVLSTCFWDNHDLQHLYFKVTAHLNDERKSPAKSNNKKSTWLLLASQLLLWAKPLPLVCCGAPLGLWYLQLKSHGNAETCPFVVQGHLCQRQLLLAYSFSSFSSIWWDLVSPFLPRTS